MLCCEGQNMSELGRRPLGVLVIALFATAMLSGVSAHEQETYNVIVVADGPMPANITDSGFVQGNAVVFRMKDTTENASIRITIDTDLDGVFNESLDNTSAWLVETCALTENGTLADEDCVVSHMYAFDLNATTGDYAYRYERAVNGTVVSSENLTITLQKDVHEEPGVPGMGDCFGIGCEEEVEVQTDDNENNAVIIAVMIGAIIGIIGLSVSIIKESKEAEQMLKEEE
jgi:hypothetical protein